MRMQRSPGGAASVPVEPSHVGNYTERAPLLFSEERKKRQPMLNAAQNWQ
jgi:hypothetical protein